MFVLTWIYIYILLIDRSVNQCLCMFIMSMQSGLMRENIVKMKQKRSDTSGVEVLKRVEGDILILLVWQEEEGDVVAQEEYVI